MSEDDAMVSAYQNKKDLYATLGVGVYKNDYWDNMEKHEDGSPNPEGKKRRKSMKTVMLGRQRCPITQKCVMKTV